MVSIAFTGDVMIGRLVDQHLVHASPEVIWGNVLPLLRGTDLNVINLEAALTVSEDEVPKVFNFKSHPAHVQSLLAARVDVANLANNHVLDYGVQGLLETLDTLDQASIAHVGAGRNLEEAHQPAIITKKGVTIGILGCTDNEPDWIATEESPGTRYLEVGDLAAIVEDITKLKEQVDLVIASIHWGPNMLDHPLEAHIPFAHALIDAGVDIIHGHSSHVFQGIECYNGGLILYDTGEFVDDYAIDPYLRNDRSFLFLVDVDKEGLYALRLVPILIDQLQVNLARDDEAKETIEKMRQLSKEFGTSLSLTEEPSLIFSWR